jgi:hypothetical protein
LNTKDNIRYMNFHATEDGGRRFEFSVKGADQEYTIISVDIPGSMFTGTNRIMVQEGVGICFEKLRTLYENAEADPIPTVVLLTEQDITKFRQMPTQKGRQPIGVIDRNGVDETKKPDDVDWPGE